MRKKTAFILSILALPMFSGCSFFSPSPIEKKAPLIIEQSGTIEEKKGNFLETQSYVLQNDNKETIAEVFSDVISLNDFVEMKVVISAELQENDKSNKSNYPILRIIQIANISPHKKHKFPFLGISFSLDSKHEIEERNNRVLVLKANESFIVFKKYIPSEQFLKLAQDISLGENSALRNIKGERIEIFFPKKNILAEFWGEKEDIYHFYEFLENIEFIETKEEKVEEENTEKANEAATENILESEESSPEIERASQKPFFEYIQKNISSILPEDKPIKILKIALYQESLADIEYTSLTNVKKRAILEYEKTTEGWNFSHIAKYKKGEVMSWDLIEGDQPILSGESEIFFADINKQNPITLPEKFTLYLSTHFDFQIGYPRNLYFKAQGKSDKNLAQVAWGKTPNISENEIFLLEILDGKEEKKRELLSENAILLPRNERTHFKLSIFHEKDWNDAVKMAKTLLIAK